MAQLSRPYQVMIVLVAVLALAWFTVLHSHVSPSSQAGSSQGPSGAKAGAFERNESKPTRVYHGSAPGLEGLSKDIRRAHEAVATSNAQAQKPQSGQAASATAPSAKGSVAQSASSTHPASRAGAKAHSRPSAATHAVARSHARSRGSSRLSVRRRPHLSPAATVAAQLKQGKIVLLLFWKSSSSDDRAVHAQVQAASRALRRRVAADYAKPSEVGAFGTVTRNVSIVQTPTLLIINRKGLVTTITGLTDAFAIEQAVREAGG